MHTKLTLRLDHQLVIRAKQHAKENKKSLSQIVSDYFLIMQQEHVPEQKLPPLTASLKGILKTQKKLLGPDDYQSYLTKKYL